MNKLQKTLINVGAGAAIAAGFHEGESYVLSHYTEVQYVDEQGTTDLARFMGDVGIFVIGCAAASSAQTSMERKNQGKQLAAVQAAKVIESNRRMAETFAQYQQ